MDKYTEALNSISSYEIWYTSSYDDDGYCNDDDYTEYPFSDSEDIEILSELITKYDNLNKGIDELIEKYNKRFDPKEFYLDVENTMACEFIKELKKLKGE